MAGGPHTRLARLSNAQDSTLSNILLDNFISLYDWGFLDRGQFYNIDIPESGRPQLFRRSGVGRL